MHRTRPIRPTVRLLAVVLAAVATVAILPGPPAHANHGVLARDWEHVGTLYPGNRSNAVMAVQGYMMQSGYYEASENVFIDALRKRGTSCSTSYAVSVDGAFGPCTKAAVQGFQSDHGLSPDGVVGPRTWRTLQNVSAHSPGCVADGRTCPYGNVSHPRPFVQDFRYDAAWDLWAFYHWPRSCWTDAVAYATGPCFQENGGRLSTASAARGVPAAPEGQTSAPSAPGAEATWGEEGHEGHEH